MRLGTSLLHEGRTLQGVHPKLADFCSAPVAGFYAAVDIQKGYYVKTVAEMGGWKSARTVLDTYAHALEDRTINNALFDTNLAQREFEINVSNGKKGEKKNDGFPSLGRGVPPPRLGRRGTFRKRKKAANTPLHVTFATGRKRRPLCSPPRC